MKQWLNSVFPVPAGFLLTAFSGSNATQELIMLVPSWQQGMRLGSNANEGRTPI